MNIENQVCSFEQAKKMKELGIKKPSMLRWFSATRKSSGEFIGRSISSINPYDLRDCIVKEFNAYTTSELGIMLPEELIHPDSLSNLIQWTYCEKGFICDFRLMYRNNNNSNNRIPDKPIFAKTEAEARAKMLIYLLEKYGYSLELILRRCQFIK